jgi:hypothetical protein
VAAGNDSNLLEKMRNGLGTLFMGGGGGGVLALDCYQKVPKF